MYDRPSPRAAVVTCPLLVLGASRAVIRLPSMDGAFSTLADVGELFQDALDDPLAFLDVLHLAAAEQDVDQHLVVVFQELPGLVDLGLDVVLARLGANADFLQLLLVRLGLGGSSRTARTGTCRSP